MSKISKLLQLYEKSSWLRAIVQLPPGGGSIDTLLAGKAAGINQKRVEELLENVNYQIEALDGNKINKSFLESEEFFEIFRTAAEIAARSANKEKRRLVAAYLSGAVRNGSITDLSTQILEDMRSMQPTHFQLLAILPIDADQGVNKKLPPEALREMPKEVYEKGMADLERYGFIRYNTAGIGTLGGGGGHWETTKYVRIFREHVQS